MRAHAEKCLMAVMFFLACVTVASCRAKSILPAVLPVLEQTDGNADVYVLDSGEGEHKKTEAVGNSVLDGAYNQEDKEKKGGAALEGESADKEITKKEETHPTDYVSATSIASVVHLSCLIKAYAVSGLRDGYTITYTNGELDVGYARICGEETQLVSVGSGVVINPKGIIISNAHVTRAYPRVIKDGNMKAVCVPVLADEAFRNFTQDGSTLSYDRCVQNWPSFYDWRTMYVSVSDVNDIENNNTQVSLKYAALITADDKDTYGEGKQDRAILQVIAKINGNIAIKDFDGWEELDMENFRLDDLHMPYTKMANPFDVSFVDNGIRAVGFPGVGDEMRAANTSGNFLGYRSKERSDILHTAFISYGSSGGGLFYNDRLIGINTSFDYHDASHPVSIAQPITYWYDLFALDKDTNALVPASWIASDPSSGDYKKECVLVLRASEADKEKLYAYKFLLYSGLYDTDAYDKIPAYPLGALAKMLFARNLGDTVYSIPKDSTVTIAVMDEAGNIYNRTRIAAGGLPRKYVTINTLDASASADGMPSNYANGGNLWDEG